jgi:hypothetical protein
MEDGVRRAVDNEAECGVEIREGRGDGDDRQRPPVEGRP